MSHAETASSFRSLCQSQDWTPALPGARRRALDSSRDGGRLFARRFRAFRFLKPLGRVFLIFGLVDTIHAAEWPAWRGDGTGVVAARGLSLSWTSHENVCWSAPIPGYGWSSPVVAGDRIFLTTAVSDQQAPPLPKGPGGGSEAPNAIFRWEVHCLDRATGRTLWQQVAAEHNPTTGNHPSNTYASETPVTDGEHVYAYFGMVGVFCYDLAGKLVWSKDLGAYKTFANWGSSSSPAFDGERLFILCDNEQKSFLVALDKKSGRELWRVARDERSTWSTPIIWQNAKRTELVAMGSNYIRSYDPVTGREIWWLASEHSLGQGEAHGSGSGAERRTGGPGAPPPGPPPGAVGVAGSRSAGGPGGPRGGGGKAASGGCKASPVGGRDLLFVGMSSKSHGTELGPMWAVKAGAAGDISLKHGETSNAGVAWFRDDAGPHFTSALLYQDRLYVFPPHDHGVLSCFDAKTGATIYAEPLVGAAGFKASPCAVDGKIMCTDERGVTFVLDGGARFQVIRKNSLDEMTWASPAVVGDAIYLRTVSQLYCVASGSALPASNMTNLNHRLTNPAP